MLIYPKNGNKWIFFDLFKKRIRIFPKSSSMLLKLELTSFSQKACIEDLFIKQ